MTALPRRPLRALDFFVLRTPLLPFSTLHRWSEGLQATTGGASVLEQDRARLRSRLREMCADPVMREALFLAAPELEESLPAWEHNPTSEGGQKIEPALVRYLLRMSSRPTPFGLFGGFSLGHAGPQTRLTLAPFSQYSRVTRLDMDFVCAFADAVAHAPEQRRRLSCRPNSSLYRIADQFRYVETRRVGVQRTRHLAAVDANEAIVATLERAALGATPTVLADALTALDPELTREASLQFIDGLLEAQVLVTDFVPPLTGPLPVDALERDLRGAGLEDLADRLRQLQDGVDALDRRGLGNPTAAYRELAREAQALPGALTLSKLFQVDLQKPAPEATLGPAVQAELLRGAELFRSFVDAGPGPLARFRERFVERYEEREVPLLEALDGENGIGLEERSAPSASPLLEGLALGGGRPAPATLRKKDRLLSEWVARALQRGERELVLTPAELAQLGAAPMPFSESPTVLASIAAASQEALDRGDFQVFFNVLSGPSGSMLLGRFCHGAAALTEAVRALTALEQSLQPEAVFAEIVYLPDERAGNLILRPVLRDYEIPYLARSGAPGDHQLPVGDLWLSVREDRLVLRSRRLNREVLPRLANAHAFASAGLEVYRFLGLLQLQRVTAAMAWSWGPLEALPFLPRLRSGKTVFARARWQLSSAQLRALADAGPDEAFTQLQALRAELNLPRYLLFAEGDHELLLDLDNILSVNAVVPRMTRRGSGVLTELFPGPDALVARGPEGAYVHELIVPLLREPTDLPWPARVVGPEPGESRLRRSFPPGSSWAYVKVYAGEALADRLLTECLAPHLERAAAQGLVGRWFFLRYRDPDAHLRLRFHGNPTRLQQEFLPPLLEDLERWVEEGQAWKVQLDTYRRETERYGGEAGMPLAEQLFDADSRLTLGWLAAHPGEEGLGARWRLAFEGMHHLMEALGLDLAARARVTAKARASFAQEHGAGKVLETQLSARYRTERASLEPRLRAAQAPGLLAYRERVAQLGLQLRAAESAGKLTQSLETLAASYLHMHANRVLRSGQRAQELVLYDFLSRAYASQLARAASQGELGRRAPGAAHGSSR